MLGWIKYFDFFFLGAYHDQLIYPYLIILDVIYPNLVIHSAFLLTGVGSRTPIRKIRGGE